MMPWAYEKIEQSKLNISDTILCDCLLLGGLRLASWQNHFLVAKSMGGCLQFTVSQFKMLPTGIILKKIQPALGTN